MPEGCHASGQQVDLVILQVDRGTDFGIEDQRAIRAEMAAGLGEDLTR